MPKFDCKNISKQDAIRYTRLTSASLFLFNFLLVLAPTLTDIDGFDFIFVVIALIWGVSAAAPFFFIPLKTSNKQKESRSDSSGQSLCLTLKRGLLATVVYWSVIYLLYFSGSLENGMLAGFMMLLSPFIIRAIMASALRKQNNDIH